MELRGPDPAGNPYLVIGLILAAGLDGIQRKLPLPKAVNRNLFHPSAAAGLESLPHTLREAIRGSRPERVYQRRAAGRAAKQIF